MFGIHCTSSYAIMMQYIVSKILGNWGAWTTFIIVRWSSVSSMVQDNSVSKRKTYHSYQIASSYYGLVATTGCGSI